MVLEKTLSLSERVMLKSRAEGYNLFNRVQLGQPGNLTSDPGTFDQSTSEVRRADLTTGARQIQFGVKLTFRACSCPGTGRPGRLCPGRRAKLGDVPSPLR